jgi:choline dehydrogenase-like flavoprotein
MNELDRRSVLRALDLFAAQLWLCHRARIHVPDSMDNELQEWVQNFKDVAHHIGGTRMADDPQRGVVDRNCRVHGVDNLFIAGSSVFPTSGQTNPTMTIVALALRLADELKRSLKGAGRSPA